MRKGLFASLLATVGMIFALGACGQQATPSTVSIDNKEEMQAAWLGDDESRTLALTVTKNGQEINALNAVQEGDLVITSSNTSVATVQGLKITPVDGEGGKSTITATFDGVSDSVEVTVTKVDHHGKKADDPLTVAEAIAVCEETGQTQTSIVYFVRGVVTGITAAYDSGYGNISFKIGATKTATETVTVYRAKPATDVDPLIINRGSEVLVSGYLINYNGNTPEVNQGGTIHSATQGDTPQTIVATVSEALAVIAALPDNESTFDKYDVTGYVTNVKDNGDFYMSDTKGAVAEPTGTDFLVYGWRVLDPTDAEGKRKIADPKIVVNARVRMVATLKNYVSTSGSYPDAYETNTPDSVTFLGIDLESITLNETTLNRVAGSADFTLVATANPADAKLEGLVWASDTPTVATVSDAGVVKFLAAGTAKITATVGSIVATCNVTVVAAEVHATSVDLAESLALTFPGATGELTATVTPANTTNSVEWSNTDDEVATVEIVEGKAVVTPLKVGTTTVTVDYKDNAGAVKATASCTVTVSAKHGTVETDPLTAKEAYDLAATDTTTVYYIKGVTQSVGKAYDPDASTPVDYDTLNLYVNGIDTFQLYHLGVKSQDDADAAETIGAIVVAKGTLSIFGSTHEAGSPEFISATVPTTVSMILVDGDTDFELGNTLELTATTYPTSVAGTVVWASGNEAVATVADGVVSGVAEGEAAITATVGDVSVSYTVHAWEVGNAPHGKVPADPLTVSEAVEIGNALDDQAKTQERYYITGYVDQVVYAWSSQYGTFTNWISDGTNRFECYSVVTDQAHGEKVALGSTLVIRGQIKRYGTTIETDSGKANLVSVDNTNFTLVQISGNTVVGVGASSTLTATAYPLKDNNGNNNVQPASFAWTTGNADVATVGAATGEVSGVGAGNVDITATAEGLDISGTAQVIVGLAQILRFTGASNTTAAAATTAGTLTTDLNLDPAIMTVTYDKNGASNDCALRTDGIRMYATKQSTNGNKFTITANAAYQIDTVVINFDDGYSSTAQVIVGDNVIAGTNGVYTLGGVSSFTLFDNNSAVNSNTQVRFQSIVIIYSAVSA